MNKSGLTMVQIVLYVVIFFALVAITTGTNMAMNSNVLKDKGEIYVEEAEIKLKNNLINSMNNSDTVEIISDKIVFSNNDIYEYDGDKMILYKNNGILIQNITSFDFKISDYTSEIKYIEVDATILKYSNQNDFKFILFKGDDV